MKSKIEETLTALSNLEDEEEFEFSDDDYESTVVR